jgi:glycosyltransferase involved in cell wall biosynthesis
VLLRSFRPDAVITQSPYEAVAVLLARRLTGSHVRVITDVQGDWRSATRLYGSRHRARLSPAADRLARIALRRVDAVRTISPYTARLVRELGIEPAASFPTFVDLRAFSGRAPVDPPSQPVALFVGVLEPYKNIDGLAAAWRAVAPRLPGATLHVVGKGTREDVVASLVADCPESVRWTPELDADGVSAALDQASLLVLPSRSEGMGRVVIEAFCRARPVIGSRVGGIPDLVEDGVNGVLVAAGDTAALADALVSLLGDRELAARLGTAAAVSARPWLQTPQEFAARTRTLVERGAPV